LAPDERENDRCSLSIVLDVRRSRGVRAGAAHSDSADYSFTFKGVEKRNFVRTGIDIVKCPDAFQAYDEGSIPFTRSNT
jgi:hypothetical protein